MNQYKNQTKELLWLITLKYELIFFHHEYVSNVPLGFWKVSKQKMCYLELFKRFVRSINYIYK